MKEVPIRNIYYLLSYAWDTLDEAELVNAGIDDFKDVANLLGKVLSNGCSYLFKKGLYRNYREVEEEIPGICGRLMLDRSLSGLSFQNKKAWCRYDELSYNVLPNCILKSTVRLLLRMNQLDDELHGDLKEIYSRFSDVEEINLQNHHFKKVHIHRNNAFYGFLIQVCRLIFESSALDESDGEYRFRDFRKDSNKLWKLFEEFVKNFYKKEQERYDVDNPQINWPFVSEVEEHNDLIPKMRTDIVLESDRKIIIIDTKFHSDTLVKRSDFGSVSFKSSNLYQIFAYMQHIPNPENKKVEGVLLYPDVGDSIQANYSWRDQQLTFKTVDLDQEWKDIRKELFDLMNMETTK